MVIAEEDGGPVGLAHAGIRANRDESALDPTQGVVCAVVVDPRHRRRGIGRQLVREAERYLRSSGATSITAGPAPEQERRMGYAQALLLDVGKRLRDEQIGCIEMHAPESNAPLTKLLESCGYERIDVGVEYRAP